MTFSWVKKLSNSFSGAAAGSPFEQDRDRLFAAARSNDTRTIDDITGRYADEFAEWKTTKGSALDVAQKNGCLDAFRLLIERGASVDENYGDGVTPLLRAIKEGQNDFVVYLLDKGADLNAMGTLKKDSDGDSCKFRPLYAAVWKGNKDVAIALLERGADPSLQAKPRSYDQGLIEYAERQKEFVIRDHIKRAGKLRAEYLAKQPAQPAAPAATTPAVDDKIAVLNPLQLKKTGEQAAPGV